MSSPSILYYNYQFWLVSFIPHISSLHIHVACAAWTLKFCFPGTSEVMYIVCTYVLGKNTPKIEASTKSESAPRSLSEHNRHTYVTIYRLRYKKKWHESEHMSTVRAAEQSRGSLSKSRCLPAIRSTSSVNTNFYLCIIFIVSNTSDSLLVSFKVWDSSVKYFNMMDQEKIQMLWLCSCARSRVIFFYTVNGILWRMCACCALTRT